MEYFEGFNDINEELPDMAELSDMGLPGAGGYSWDPGWDGDLDGALSDIDGMPDSEGQFEGLIDENDTAIEEAYENGAAEAAGNDDEDDGGEKRYYDRHSNTWGFRIRLRQNEHPTQEQCIAIMDAYHNGTSEERDQALVDMLAILEGYIHYVIKTQYPTYEQKHGDDLEMSAIKGMLMGMDKYDPLKGKPTTWFGMYIKHEMNRYIDSMVNHSSPHFASASKKIFRAIAEKEQEGKKVTIKDLYIETGIPIKTIQKCLRIKTASNSLPFESNSRITQQLQSSLPTPEDAAVENERRSILQGLILGTGPHARYSAGLTENEQLCLLYKYGFITAKEEGISAIAEYTGIPKQNIRKHINSGEDKLRGPLRHIFGRDRGGQWQDGQEIGTIGLSKEQRDWQSEMMDRSFRAQGPQGGM